MVISGLHGSFFSQIAAAILFKKKNRHHRKSHIKFIIKKIKQLLVLHCGKKAITLQPLLREC